MSLPRGRIEKMVPTEILFSRLADPSSGSIATQSGASGVEGFRQRGFLGKDSCNRCMTQCAAHQVIGGDIDILLLIAVGIGVTGASGVMPASGPSAINAASSIAAPAMASITSPTAAPCGDCDADRSRCERKVTRSSMDVSPASSSGRCRCVSAGRQIRCSKEA